MLFHIWIADRLKVTNGTKTENISLKINKKKTHNQIWPFNLAVMIFEIKGIKTQNDKFSFISSLLRMQFFSLHPNRNKIPSIVFQLNYCSSYPFLWFDMIGSMSRFWIFWDFLVSRFRYLYFFRFSMKFSNI